MSAVTRNTNSLPVRPLVSETAAAIPDAVDVKTHEIAFNIPDKKIYAKDSLGAVGLISEPLRKAASRAELAAFDKTSDVYLEEAGAQGWFRWNSEDRSTVVGVDTLQMFNVPPTGEDGSAGTWERIWSGNVQIGWSNISTDYSDVVSAANVVKVLHPSAIIELEAVTYIKSTNDSRELVDITIKGKGKGETIVRQGYLSGQTLVNVGSNANVLDMTIDANSLNTGTAIGGISSEDAELCNLEVIGWRNGVQFFSDSTGASKRIKLKNVITKEPGSNGQVYPIRFNAPWGTDQIEDVSLENVEAYGSGGAYSSVSTAGTADQISFQNCKKVRLKKIISAHGGELGLNFSRDTTDVRGDDIVVYDCDADGVNVGSGQLVIEVADVSGFVVDTDSAAIDIAGISGEIETISGNFLYIASASLSLVERFPEDGDSVTGRLGGSSSVVSWRSSADDVVLTSVKSYGNGRDDVATGNLYAGLKLNLSTNVQIKDSNLSESSAAPVQKYGIYAINSTYAYQYVTIDNNLSAPVLDTGRTKALVLPASVAPAQALTMPKGSNANIISGVISVDGSAWRRVAPETGTRDTITDITGSPADGEMLMLSNASNSTTTDFESNARLRMPALSMRGLYDRVVLVYNSAGSGHWALFSSEIAKVSEESVTEVAIANTTVETDVVNFTIPADTLGAYKLCIAGYLTNISGASVSAVINVKLGATTLYSDTTVAMISGAQQRPFETELFIRSVGASSQKVNGRFVIGANGAASTGAGDLGTDEINANSVIRGVSSESESTDLDFSVSVQFSSADASVSLVRDFYQITEL